MFELFLYFNEQCLEAMTLTSVSEGALKTSAQQFYETWHRVQDLRKKLEGRVFIGMPSSVSLGDVIQGPSGVNRSLIAWLKLSLPPDAYRLLLKNIHRLQAVEHSTTTVGEAPHAPPWNEELLVHSVPATGLLYAYRSLKQLGGGWGISLSLPASPWLNARVAATFQGLTEQGDVVSEACEVPHLSMPEHVKEWHSELHAFGLEPLPSAVLAYLEAHPIVMYSSPREHNPPHVHVLNSRSESTTWAKYRIEDQVREKGPAENERRIQEWLRHHKQELLHAWERCQRGLHPYRISEPAP